MENETKEAIQEYVDMFVALRDKVGTDGALLITQEIGKNTRVKRMSQWNKRESKSPNGFSDTDDIPATAKQISYLKRLDVAVPEGLSKQQASDLIDEHNSKD